MWTQPILTANGTIGVDEFAVASGGGATSDAYKAFDGSASSYVNKMNSGAWLSFYSKTFLVISGIALTDGDGYLPAQGIFQVSYDGGETWQQCGTWQDTDALGTSANVVIDGGNVTGQYFRLLSQSRSIPKPNGNAGFYNIVITADTTNEFPLTLNCDVERRLKWRYDNYGTADTLIISGTTLNNLPESQSRTGSAFYQTTRAKCFDLPAASEVWIKFDVYFDGSNRWRAYNDKDGEICGVCSYVNNSNYDFGLWQNNTRIQDFSGVCKTNQLQTVLLHMITGSSAGVIEAWVDGALIYSYSGDVNHGQDFADIYLQSDGAGTFFSNVIISNAQIGLNENAKVDNLELTLTLDVKRRVETPEHVANLFSSLTAWLPFDKSPTFDVMFNEWTAYGTPAISGNALQLDGQSYIKLSGIELGGQDFQVDGWVYVDSSSPNNARILNVYSKSTGYRLVTIRKNTSDPTKLDVWANAYADVSQDSGYTYVSTIDSVGKRVHFKLIYRYTDKRLSLCINDIIAADWTSATQFNRQLVDIYIGALSNGNQGLIGSIDELRIWNGTWFSYNYGVVPTAEEYEFFKNRIPKFSFTVDTERRVKNIVEFSADVSRLVKNVTNVAFAADVRRNVTRSNFFAADVVRNVTRSLELTADVEVLDVIPVEFIADINRAIVAKVNLYSTDTSDYFSGGTSTPVIIPTQDVVPPVEGDANLQSIEISIAEQQLTDQVKVVGITPLDILFPVQGQFLDYVCDMCVEKVQRQGILYSADCCSDIDEILYTQFNYKLDSGFTYFAPDYDSMTLAKIISDIDDNEPPPNLIRKGRATAHLQKIADLLGKNCVCQFDDFTSNMNENQSDVTFGDLISQLFGWTSRLPQRLINCYLRDDTLFAIQRGHESNVIDITDAEITLPTYERKLIRTLWGSGKLGIEPTTESEHVNNKHMVGGAKVFPMPPTTSPDGKTSYDYHNVSGYGGIDHGYALTSTTTRNDDGSRHEVKYLYGFEQSVYVCTGETAKDYDANGNLVSENKIIHHNLTPSQQFSRVEDEDGITTASNVGSNLPGFYNESYWLSLPHEVGYERDINKITGFNPLIDTDFPVLDSDIYAALIDAYAWLNRRTQETVTLSIYNCPHLFDFNDRILLDGYEYFLVGNTARTTSRIFNEQTLTLRRWF